MADILSTGVSGLRAFQRALDITSHNIANVSTPGYSRQRVELQTREAERYGSGFLGTGVDVSTHQPQLRRAAGHADARSHQQLSRLDVYAGKAQALNNLFADSSTGLSASLQRFTNAVQGVSNKPTSTAARQVLLSEARGSRSACKTYDTRLDEIERRDQLAARRRGGDRSRSIADSIARLNGQIVAAQTSRAGAQRSARRARPAAVPTLAEHLSVQVVKQDDGAWNVFVGNGQSLVLGNQSANIVARQRCGGPVAADDRLPDRWRPPGHVVHRSAAAAWADCWISAAKCLIRRATSWDRSPSALPSAVNAQHREGMDLQGNLGGDLLARRRGRRSCRRSGNAGSATVAVTRTGVGALTANDYIMEYNGSAWTVRRADTGAAVTLHRHGHRRRIPSWPTVCPSWSVARRRRATVSWSAHLPAPSRAWAC